MENLFCPECKSLDSRVLKGDHGLSDPNSPNWIPGIYCICNRCGLVFKDMRPQEDELCIEESESEIQNVEVKDKIIVALDVSALEEVVDIVDDLKDRVGMFKVGLPLLTQVGSDLVCSTLWRRGVKVFYDGKFCDIPNTVYEASKAVCRKRCVK